MNLVLNKVVPFPLRERSSITSSAIWGKELSFQKGERIEVVAPSGTGKTTLVQILWNLRHDYSGSLLYDGADVRQIPAVRLSTIRQQHLSVIFQDLQLFANLTAKENVELKRLMSPQAMCNSELVDDLFDRLNIAHIADAKVATCSFGERQRIAILRALVQPFDWLIMDEPFSHLDKENTYAAVSLIEEQCQLRKAGYVVTDLDGSKHFNLTKSLKL